MLHKTIGKYRIEDVVGSGGMAIVYYAIDEELNRPTALKVLHKHWATDLIALHRFKREAQIAQRLDHPNIIKIYEFDEIDETVFLAMEFVSGGSLAKRFQNPLTTTLEQSVAMLTAIGQGLDYAHAQGVIHRDLKLENILVGDDERLILSDFGIARMINSSRITDSGAVFGTPLYISPEQIQGAKNVDYRTDLYAFAVIAYLLTTGYHPFSGSTAQATAFQHLVEPPPLPSNVNPRLPQAFDAVLVKGLAKAPEDRYESAGALAAALTEAARLDPLVETVVLMRQPTPIVARTAADGNDTRPLRSETILLDPPKRSRVTFARQALIGSLLLLALIAGIVFINGGLPISLPSGGTSAPLVAIGSVTRTATDTATSTATNTLTSTVTPSATPTATKTSSPTRTATNRTQTFTPSPTPSTSCDRQLKGADADCARDHRRARRVARGTERAISDDRAGHANLRSAHRRATDGCPANGNPANRHSANGGPTNGGPTDRCATAAADLADDPDCRHAAAGSGLVELIQAFGLTSPPDSPLHCIERERKTGHAPSPSPPTPLLSLRGRGEKSGFVSREGDPFETISPMLPTRSISSTQGGEEALQSHP